MILSPSLLSSDFGNLASELNQLEKAGLSWVHWDVMDGLFVPNITFGAPVIKRLRQTSALFFDVHLMIQQPERYIDDFVQAGADMLVVHAEATVHLDRTLQAIRSHGIKTGVALNPATPICAIENVLDRLDLILIMSVNPGFGGQSFIPHSLQKIKKLNALLESQNSSAIIQVDGGVTLDNAKTLVEAGATALVSGSGFFSGSSYAERHLEFIAATKRNSPAQPAATKAREWKHKG